MNLRRIFRKSSIDRTLDEEMRSYLEHDINSRIEAGVDPIEARRQALLEFGGIEQVKEVVREGRTGAWLDSVLRDFRYAFRTLLQARTFSLWVIGSLSVGIAVTTAGFAFINAIMFQPSPGIERQEELAELRVTQGCDGKPECWYPSSDDYVALRDGMSGFSAFTGFTMSDVVYNARLEHAVLVFPDYFETLGVRAAIGRGLTKDDTDAVVIGNDLWKREFDGDPAAVGKSIRIGDHVFQIVGVAPADFRGVNAGLGSVVPYFWLPMTYAREIEKVLTNGFFRFVGRRKPNTAISNIRAEAEIVFSQIASSRNMVTVPGRADALGITNFDSAKVPAAMTIIMLVPLLILLLSCVNAANMVFGRGAVRDREIAIRLSMGASRSRVIRQLLIESLVLSIAAAFVAVPLVQMGLSLVARFLASNEVLGAPMPIDGRVLAGTLITAFASAFAFGLTPALRMTSLNPARTLVGSGTPLQVRIRRNLVIAQVALSLALLVVGTQLVTTLLAMGGSAGIAADRLLLASFNLDQIKLSPEEAVSFYQRLAERVGKLPQVEVAGVGPALWFFGGRVINMSDIHRLRFWKPDSLPDASLSVRGGTVDAGLFQTVGMGLVAGRWFNDEDRKNFRPQVAIVNRAFETRVLQKPAVGSVIHLAGSDQKYPAALDVEIVGVVENFSEPRNERNGSGPGPFIYTPAPVTPEPSRVLYVRSHGEIEGLSAAVAAAVREIDPRVPIGNVGSLEDLNYRSLPEAQMAQGAQILGFVALALATFGMYGVMSFAVAQRSREIAIRMALGAEGKRVLRMVLKQAMSLAAIGAVWGSILAVIASLLLQVANKAPLGIHRFAFAGCGLLLLLAMLLASAIPAIRASRVDPVENLRHG